MNEIRKPTQDLKTQASFIYMKLKPFECALILAMTDFEMGFSKEELKSHEVSADMDAKAVYEFVDIAEVEKLVGRTGVPEWPYGLTGLGTMLAGIIYASEGDELLKSAAARNFFATRDARFAKLFKDEPSVASKLNRDKETEEALDKAIESVLEKVNHTADGSIAERVAKLEAAAADLLGKQKKSSEPTGRPKTDVHFKIDENEPDPLATFEQMQRSFLQERDRQLAELSEINSTVSQLQQAGFRKPAVSIPARDRTLNAGCCVCGRSHQPGGMKFNGRAAYNPAADICKRFSAHLNSVNRTPHMTSKAFVESSWAINPRSNRQYMGRGADHLVEYDPALHMFTIPTGYASKATHTLSIFGGNTPDPMGDVNEVLIRLNSGTPVVTFVIMPLFGQQMVIHSFEWLSSGERPFYFAFHELQ